MNEAYQPADVGKMLGVDASTIRRWSAAHRAHMSPTANPPPGGKRLLTPTDIEVLRTVQALRIEGLPVNEINTKLANLTFATLADDTEAHQNAPDGPGAQIAPIVGNDALMTLAPLLEGLAELPALRDRVTVLETQRPSWRDVILFVLSAFIAGLIVGLAVWWFQ